jgi:hypothetical protein
LAVANLLPAHLPSVHDAIANHGHEIIDLDLPIRRRFNSDEKMPLLR